MVLALLVGLLRGGFWAATTQIWSPVDEAQHYDYVDRVGHGLPPPRSHADRIRPAAMEYAKESATSWWRPAPVPPDPSDNRWGTTTLSYEGVQTPLYYMVIALPVRLASQFGTLASIFAARFLTVLIALGAVALIFWAGRVLFPEDDKIAVAAAFGLVAIQGFNGNLAIVTNDALATTLATAALVPLAGLIRHGPSRRNALLAGACIGLGVLSKSNVAGLGLAAAVLVLGRAFATRQWRVHAVWLATCGAVVAVLYAPWAAMNLIRYGEFSGAAAEDKATGSLLPAYPLNLRGIGHHASTAVSGLVDLALAADPDRRTTRLFAVFVAVLVLGGIAAALLRRRGGHAASIAWLAAVPLCILVTMLVIVYVPFHGRSQIVGRHLLPGLPALVLGASAGAVALLRSWAAAGWAAMVTVLLLSERGDTHRYFDAVYADGVVADLAPVIEQSYADDVGLVTSVTLRSPCPVRAVSFAFAGPPPNPVVVHAGGREAREYSFVETGNAVMQFTGYRVERPSRTVTVEFAAPAAIAVGPGSLGTDAGAVVAEPPIGQPAVRGYCRVADPKATRFRQLFVPEHPDWISLPFVRAWPSAWVAVVGASALALAGRRIAGRL